MVHCRLVLLTSAVACLLLLSLSCVDAERKFDFPPGSAKANLGVSRLARIKNRSKQEMTVDELANLIEQDPDLGVDLDNDILVYACAGLVVDPNSPAALAAASAAAAADAEAAAARAAQAAAVPTDTAQAAAVPTDTAQAAAVPTDAAQAAAVPTDIAAEPAAEAPGHHHHHHRHLLQTGVEFASLWQPSQADTAITRTDVLRLHSRPNSARKIFLDFDGHTATGTVWNDAANSSIVTPAYDTDSNPADWSAAELSNILAIWRAVSEDYAPFDVDVTTEEPVGLPLAQWVRAVIGGDGAWYGGAGGVAYVGVWGRSDHYYQPAFVFPGNLGKGYAKYVWEAVSHEVGHNLGLSHDGVLANPATGAAAIDYYTGHAVPGSDGWAPIMGVGYYQPNTQFSRGEYPLANQKQDDFSFIAGRLPYIFQAHGTTIATATALSGVLNARGASATATMLGIVRGPGETEVLKFTSTAAGTATIQVSAVTPWGSTSRSNFMMNLAVTRADGTAVTPAKTGLGIPAFSVSVPAGTYYLSLKGVGMGDPTSAAGFSDYGSRGQYQVAVTYPTLPLLYLRSLFGSTSPAGIYSRTCSLTVVVVDINNVVVPTASVTARFTSYRAGSAYTHSVTGTTSSTGWVMLTNTAKTITSLYAESLLNLDFTDDCTMTVTSMSKAGFESTAPTTSNSVTRTW